MGWGYENAEADYWESVARRAKNRRSTGDQTMSKMPDLRTFSQDDLTVLELKINQERDERERRNRIPVEPDGLVVFVVFEFQFSTGFKWYQYAALKACGYWYVTGDPMKTPEGGLSWENMITWFQKRGTIRSMYQATMGAAVHLP